jgi:FKBP-type peptidyl-prolyl cis-trans isomerase FklB
MIKKRLLAILCIAVTTIPCVADEAPKLGSDKEKISYMIGRQVGENLTQQGIELDLAAFSVAIQDITAGRESRLSREEVEAVVARQQSEMKKAREQLAEKNRAAGKAFMEENGKKEGVEQLSNGIQYKVIKAGTGAKPKATDTVSVNYRGTLIDGQEFDSSELAGKPVSFGLNAVIKGWQEALVLMPEGSKWQVVIPPDLAYGAQGAGGRIGPHSTLVFDIELVAIGPAKESKASKAGSEAKGD